MSDLKRSNPQRRYVKFVFEGYAPVDLVTQVHMIAKAATKNIVGAVYNGELSPYEEYLGEYTYLIKGDKVVKDE